MAQLSPSAVQPGLEHFQGWGTHNFSWQPGPGSHHPDPEAFLPNISYKPALDQLETDTLHPVQPFLIKCLSPHIITFKFPRISRTHLNAGSYLA